MDLNLNIRNNKEILVSFGVFTPVVLSSQLYPHLTRAILELMKSRHSEGACNYCFTLKMEFGCAHTRRVSSLPCTCGPWGLNPSSLVAGWCHVLPASSLDHTWFLTVLHKWNYIVHDLWRFVFHSALVLWRAFQVLFFSSQMSSDFHQQMLLSS